MKAQYIRYIALLWASVLLVGLARAELTIEITEGMEGALPIAVVPFGWDASESRPPVDVAEVVSADLTRTGRFSVVPEKVLVSQPHEGAEVEFQPWRVMSVDYLVVGRVLAMGPASYQVRFQLFDVYQAEQLAGYSITSSAKQLRYTAHHIADLIYEALTGQMGAFTTRIAYITAQRGPDDSLHYALQVADADGYNPHTIVSSDKPLMSPAWSPDGTQIAYVAFDERGSAVYVQEVSTGERHRIAAYDGINGAPAWSPNGQELALTLSKDGSPDIYVHNLRSRGLRRLTRHYAIDTEPEWAPDGDSLVFTSDRGGQPQIYRMDASGGEPSRVTFEGQYNARARFSPDGKQLALVHGEGGQFRIGLLNLDTGILQLLTNGRLDEAPSFAPNGSMIIYATSDGQRGILAAVSLDGRIHQRLAVQEGDVREPAWSPE